MELLDYIKGYIFDNAYKSIVAYYDTYLQVVILQEFTGNVFNDLDKGYLFSIVRDCHLEVIYMDETEWYVRRGNG